jgi:hypothetical protein
MEGSREIDINLCLNKANIIKMQYSAVQVQNQQVSNINRLKFEIPPLQLVSRINQTACLCRSAEQPKLRCNFANFWPQKCCVTPGREFFHSPGRLAVPGKLAFNQTNKARWQLAPAAAAGSGNALHPALLQGPECTARFGPNAVAGLHSTHGSFPHTRPMARGTSCNGGKPASLQQGR